VTLQDIARHLDVSTATVSLALRDAAVVAETTRQKVRAAARELGYIYNRSAASLRTARSNILAVGFHDITNPYFAEMLSAIEEAAITSGHTILLGTYSESLERQARVLGTLREHRPDGMIMCPAGGTTPEVYRDLVEAGIPVVQVSREVGDAGLDFVGSDDSRGIEIALQHLIALGHRRIALIGGNESTSTGKVRHAAYRTTLALNGIGYDPGIVYRDWGTRETGFRGIQHVLDHADPPTAAVCFNDLTAFGAMLGLRHRNHEAGSDFSIVGCDDVKEAAQWYPGLTTIRNRQEEMGRKAAELLMRRIAEPDAAPRHVLLEPDLVVRGSTIPSAIQ
jgi:LacI family transcriptional regulator